MTRRLSCPQMFAATLVAILLMHSGASVNAQPNPNATPEELKKLKDEADLKKALYTALQEADAAKRAYEATLDPAKQTATDQAAAVKAAKDAADAQAAVANAQKAQYEAELAALKKKYGDFAASGLTGAVEVGTGAGSAEGHLLGGLAIQRAAAEFAAALEASGASQFILCSTSTTPDFQALTAFEAQHLAMSGAILRARQSTDTAPAANGGVRIESVAQVGAALDAVSRLLSFAKSDYKFAALDLSGTDTMLLRAMARLLPKNSAEVPGAYVADLTTATNTVLKKAEDINTWLIDAKRGVRFYERSVAALEKEAAAKPADETVKERLQKARESLATWKAVSEALEAWSRQLTTADDKGNSPIATVIRQSAIKRKLDGGAALVIVELHKLAGTTYTIKNLLSSIGKNPFYVMGGAVASFVALDGTTGKVIASDLVPVHGGYHSISDVRSIVNRGLTAQAER